MLGLAGPARAPGEEGQERRGRRGRAGEEQTGNGPASALTRDFRRRPITGTRRGAGRSTSSDRGGPLGIAGHCVHWWQEPGRRSRTGGGRRPPGAASTSAVWSRKVLCKSDFLLQMRFAPFAPELLGAFSVNRRDQGPKVRRIAARKAAVHPEAWSGREKQGLPPLTGAACSHPARAEGVHLRTHGPPPLIEASRLHRAPTRGHDRSLRRAHSRNLSVRLRAARLRDPADPAGNARRPHSREAPVMSRWAPPPGGEDGAGQRDRKAPAAAPQHHRKAPATPPRVPAAAGDPLF